MKRGAVLAAICAAGTALAHQGVTSPEVMARMEGMSALAAATKRLGQMAKGEIAFDKTAAKAALAEIRSEAARVVPLFQTRAEDPKSEAQPAIWEDFPDFTLRARALEQAASGDVGTADALRKTLAQIGAACGGCHDPYRK